jgi:hypothetical protein
VLHALRGFAVLQCYVLHTVLRNCVRVLSHTCYGVLRAACCVLMLR